MSNVGADTDTASEGPAGMPKKLSIEGKTITKMSDVVRCCTSEVKHKPGSPDDFHKHRDSSCFVCDTPMCEYCDVVCWTVVESPASSKNEFPEG